MTHRWEYDKNPAEFFRALTILAERGLEFEVAVLGRSFGRKPVEFVEAQAKLRAQVVQLGYVEDFADYAAWLWQADLLPVTSHQDFFGISLMQALYCDCYPLLPKRLAYPELIPPELHPNHFYDDFDDLVDRLDRTVRNIDPVRQQSLGEFAAHYDWGSMGPRYDAQFEAIGKTKNLQPSSRRFHLS